MTEGTLGVAAQAFGSIIASEQGRVALKALGLSGPNALPVVCALYHTTVGEVAAQLPATVLVIDLARNRIATLRLGLAPGIGEDYEVHQDIQLGFVVDGLAGTGQHEDPSGFMRAIHGEVVQLSGAGI